MKKDIVIVRRDGNDHDSKNLANRNNHNCCDMFGWLDNQRDETMGRKIKKLNWLQKIMLVLLNANNQEPIESGTRFKFMLFLCIKNFPQLRKSSTIRKFMKEVRF